MGRPDRSRRAGPARRRPDTPSAPPPATPAAPGRVRGWIAAALVGLTLAAFAPVAGHDFTNYDDPQYVTGNPVVRRGLTWDGLAWAFTTGHAANWHPLTWLSHMTDVELFGLDARAHHLVNLALHTLATLLLFFWLAGATNRPWPSAGVAALFAVHPLHVESVAWVAERKDVLSAVFWMLALHAWTRWTRHPRPGRYALACGVYALGLMAKPMLVTLPFVLLLADWWPLGRARAAGARWGRLVREKLPLFALAAASSAVTWMVQAAGGAVRGLDALPLGRRAANALLAWTGYAGQMIWPADLAPVYPYPASVPALAVSAAAIGLAGVTVLAVRFARRLPWLPAGWFWYLGTLVPVIGLVQVGTQPMADRYTYLPLIGLFIVVAWAAAGLAARLKTARAAVAVMAVLGIGACAAATGRQAAYWRDAVALWERTLAVTAGNYRAHTYLGHALATTGRTDAAIVQYETALGIRPDYLDALNNIGAALVDAGRPADALARLDAAVRIAPRFVEARNTRGLALAALGRLNEAAAEFEEALRLAPGLAGAETNLGAVRLRQGRADRAAEHFAAALARDPDAAAARNGLGAALVELGRPAEALAPLREAIALDPGLADAHTNLGHALLAAGRAAEAEAAYREAVRLAPASALARNGLGAALARLDRLDAAAREYREAIRLDPAFPDPYSNLGRALAALGQPDAALQAFLDGLAVRPEDAPLHYDAAVLYARAGRIRDAVRHLDAALAIEPGYEEARQLRARLVRPPGGGRP